MLKRRQVSLRFLFIQLTWIAACLGLFRSAIALRDDYAPVILLLISASAGAGGAAIGGFSGHWIEGIIVAVILAVISMLFLPAVMVA